MKFSGWPALLASAVTLASCGPDLAEHEFVSAQYASDLPQSVVHSRNDPGYVVLRFTAGANLNGDDINALYVTAMHCDKGDDRDMTAFGPFTDGPNPEYLPLNGSRHAVDSYLIYLPIEGEVWGERVSGRTPVVGKFDLQHDDQDVCIWLEHTGYPWATRTSALRLPASVLKQAIDGGAL